MRPSRCAGSPRARACPVRSRADAARPAAAVRRRRARPGVVPRGGRGGPRHDSAAGWCVMIVSTTAPLAAYLPEKEAARIYGGDPLTVTGGAIAPSGTGRSVKGGYGVTGRWQWGSGTQHCSWIVGGTLTDAGDYRLMFFPADDVEIIDTWYSSGFAVRAPTTSRSATSSCPRAAGCDRRRSPSVAAAALRLPLVLVALARRRVGVPRGRPTRDRRAHRAGRGQDSGLLWQAAGGVVDDSGRRGEGRGRTRLARAFLIDEISKMWDAVLAGREVSLEQRARLRLASANAGARCVEAVDLAYHGGRRHVGVREEPVAAVLPPTSTLRRSTSWWRRAPTSSSGGFASGRPPTPRCSEPSPAGGHASLSSEMKIVVVVVVVVGVAVRSVSVSPSPPLE